ncbi:hypothetical protein [Moritella viscosa]|uniref:Lipoprotein LpqB, GerMN domain n=1 Tax=Moritella viscosa TaxID=80854 RepID=A0ABY1HET1_9GAMM|nr:hypothetical protein [Moritella viscosa]SGY93131.1 Lipoprotein LpqB, GerMN domain [Moritella viscosa]SHO26602.1 Lipoprotein LpqB, GerMN domain [Moritella viscosa]
MKKLLLALPFSILLTACGSDSVEDIAHQYCLDVKQMNFNGARELALDSVVSNRQAMYEQNKGKYSMVFGSQNCNVTKIEEDGIDRTAYFGGSKLDSVMLEFSEEEDRYIVVVDAFKNDLKLY